MSIKISELPEATAIGNDDLLAIVQEGSTKKITFGNAIGKAQQITEISRNISTYYHLDEDFTVQGSLPLEEGIYYNNTKQTLGTIRIVTGFSDNTFTYTTLPYGSYLVIFPVQVYTPSLDITHRYYKLLVITRGTASVSGPYADNLVHIKSYMVTASVGDFFNTMTCVESEFENDAEAVHDELAEKQAEIDQLYAQIPTATADGETINVQDSSNLPIKDFAMLGNATQADTPTPDTPQDIHVVTGDNTVVIANKNLYNSSAETTQNGYLNNSGTYTSASDWLCVTSYMEIEPSTNYVASFKNMGTRFIWCEYNSEKTAIGTRKENTTGIITTSANAKYIRFCTNSNTATDIQLEQGTTTATPYEPYTETTQLLSLGSIELAKIGDYTDRIFKAVQGNSIYDSLDSTTKATLTLGKWYKQGNITKLVWNNESTQLGGTFATMETNGYLCRYISSSCKAVMNNDRSLIFCNRLKGTNSGLWNGANGEGIQIGNNSVAIYMAISLSTLATYYGETITSSNNGTAFNSYFTNNNTVLYYPTTDITYTEITDTTLLAQLENVLKMHTNKNVTNAWIEPTGTNAQAGLTLTYRKDLETMFDNISNS